MTSLSPLQQAIVILCERQTDNGDLVGAPLTKLRHDVAEGHYDRHPEIGTSEDVHRAVMSLGIADMSPDSDTVSLLLETLAAKHQCSRGQAWKLIGIGSKRGRDLLSRNAHAVDWPIFKTLRDAALG